MVQQRAGVHLKGGIGQEGDAHERHADAVADRVVQKRSAKDLLDPLGQGMHTMPQRPVASGVQLKPSANTSSPGQSSSGTPKPAPSGNGDSPAVKANKVFAIFQACYDDAMTRRLKWVTAAEDFGRCYYNAWKTQHDAVDKQKKADQLVADVCFGVLSSLVLGGALGGLKKFYSAHDAFHELPEWQTEGILGASAGLASAAFTGLAKPEVDSYSVSAEPFSFYINLKDAVDKHWITQVDYINKFVQVAKSAVIGQLPESEVAGWDPVALDKAVEDWKKTVVFYKEPPQVPAAELTRELEIGLWAKWAPHLKRVTHDYYCGAVGTPTQVDLTGPGRFVEERLNALGITAACGAEWGRVWDSDSDIEKFVDWGAAWHPSHTFTI